MNIVSQLSLAMVLVIGGAQLCWAETPSTWHSDLDAAWKQSQDSGQPMLLFITMDNCAYCSKMATHTFSDAGVRDTLDSSYITAAVNGGRNPQVAQKLRVQRYPATFLVAPDTRVLDRIDGYITPTEMRQRLSKASATIQGTAVR